MWFVYALGSAVFAALTSILAKIGIEGVNSTLATAIRTAVVLLMSWGMVFLTGTQTGIAEISRRSWLFLVLSGLATGAKYDDTIVALSDMLSENGLDRFNKYDCRYLCNDFNSTFCFYNTQIVKSGETVDYALRLVKKVRVEKAK